MTSIVATPTYGIPTQTKFSMLKLISNMWAMLSIYYVQYMGKLVIIMHSYMFLHNFMSDINVCSWER